MSSLGLVAAAHNYWQLLRRIGATGMSPAFGPFTRYKIRQTLTQAVRTVVTEFRLTEDSSNPFTGHCVRVGSLTSAAAVGTPIGKLAYMACHTDTRTTNNYIRYDHQATVADAQLYNFMVPTGPVQPTQ